ncbi:MAG: hypothetical protein K0R01_3945, partial [Mycobacterium sp.]|nr:hypothetical protein [Mycobacterium sp.]
MNDQDYADGLRVTMSELTAHFHEPVDIA